MRNLFHRLFIVFGGLVLFFGAVSPSNMGFAAAAGGLREALYDENADTRSDIEAALARAKQENKHVLITWGGNWCGWCHFLHKTLEDNAEINTFLRRHYVRVLADTRSNRSLMDEMKVVAPGVPYLTVLNADGEKLTDQDTEALEVGSAHDPAKVLAFLKQYQPNNEDAEAPSLAEQYVSAALDRLMRNNKRLFVKFGGEYCGWCRRLDAFLKDEAVHPVFSKDFDVVSIDQAEVQGAEALRERLSSGAPSQGIPWYAILQKDGTVVGTATGPAGNIGYPAKPAEITEFMKLLSATAISLSDAELNVIEEKLRSEAEEFGQ